MGEIKGYDCYRFTVARWSDPGWGEHDVTLYGRNWDRAFALATLMLEHKLKLPPNSGLKCIREKPFVQYDIHDNVVGEVDEFLDFMSHEFDQDNSEHVERYEEDIQEHLVFLNGVKHYEQTADTASLELLGHIAAAREAVLVVD